MSALEEYFRQYRERVIGHDQHFNGPYGQKRIVYADWTASGRLYKPIEEHLLHEIAPFVGNTHTGTSITGCVMTKAYQEARKIIKQHVGASSEDILIASHSGMTGVVNKFQRILGLKVHEKFQSQLEIEEVDRPLVFISHMEHHSNQTSWLETIAQVEIIKPDGDGLLDLQDLRRMLEKYVHRKTKYAAITSCSNVTGIRTPYHQVAALMHQYGGYCFVDFAASAPYIDIDMHPSNPEEKLDAIYFSPHKFLGGPGSCGILIFNEDLYRNKIPDHPGGGTVDWTNPWGQHKYFDAIEAREDGGTPGFLQTMRVAFAIQLKEEMGVGKMLEREKELLEIIWQRLDSINDLHLLADRQRHRLGVVSFYVEGLHYNLCVKLLNDRFGVQVRGGCSCAGTYGHYLLEVSPEISEYITSRINAGDLSQKPGWVRFSIHPIMTDEEVDFICQAIAEVVQNWTTWQYDYKYLPDINEFVHRNGPFPEELLVEKWFANHLVYSS